MLDEMFSSLSKVNEGKLCNEKIQSILAKKGAMDDESLSDTLIYWNAQSFGLDRVELFNNLDEQGQNTVLEYASTMRLEEAYHIEYAGMSYAAKMSLLAQSVEEQRLYSLFAAEEAKHFSYITQFFNLESTHSTKPFVLFLNDTIARGNRMPLILIIQVLLEGWGLDHYQGMTQNCLDRRLKAFLSEIVADEASHHGSGVILFDESMLEPSDFDFVVNVLGQFLKDVRVGAVGLMDCLIRVTGEISAGQREEVLLELDANGETLRKLNLLKRMMIKVRATKVVTALEELKLFTPALHRN